MLKLVFLSFWAISTLGKRKKLDGVLSRFVPSARHYLWADYVVPVGGGYLGNQYRNETLLTAWTWWWCCKSGRPVETMPISVELKRGLLGWIFACLVRDVLITVRDESSKSALRALGIDASLSPDLAFLNYKGCAASADVSLSVGLAMVGRDYLGQDAVTKLVKAICDGLGAVEAVSEVCIVSMHRQIGDTRIGQDGNVANLAADALTASGVAVRICSVADYSDVLKVFSDCRFVIAARMHAGIAALCCGRPVGFLAYEKKHLALMQDLGLPEFAIRIDADPDDVVSLVRRVSTADPYLFDRAACQHHDAVASHVASGTPDEF